MKKFIFFILIIIIIFCPSSANNLAIIENNNINLVINSKKISLSSPIILSNSHILFPLRELCDNLSDDSINIIWDNKVQATTILYSGKTLALTLNSNIAKLNNTEILLPCSPLLYKNLTYIPLRMVGEFFDCSVIWDDTSKTAFIKNSFDYFNTKAFLYSINDVVSNVYDVKIDIINELDNMSFGNSIYIDNSENKILEKNILNDTWHNSKISLTNRNTLKETIYLSTLAAGINLDKTFSNENYYVYTGFFPTISGKLAYGKFYIDTTNLLLVKMLSESESTLGLLKQNILFSYGTSLI